MEREDIQPSQEELQRLKKLKQRTQYRRNSTANCRFLDQLITRSDSSRRSIFNLLKKAQEFVNLSREATGIITSTICEGEEAQGEHDADVLYGDRVDGLEE